MSRKRMLGASMMIAAGLLVPAAGVAMATNTGSASTSVPAENSFPANISGESAAGDDAADCVSAADASQPFVLGEEGTPAEGTAFPASPTMGGESFPTETTEESVETGHTQAGQAGGECSGTEPLQGTEESVPAE